MNNGNYVTAPNGGTSALIAQSTSIGTAESFLVGFVSGVPPTAPANLIATAGNAQTTLNWIASAGATGYNVKRSTTSGGSYTVIATNVAATGYTDIGLVNGRLITMWYPPKTWRARVPIQRRFTPCPEL